MKALVVLGCVAIIALAAVSAFWISSRARGARQARRELARHERFLEQLRRDALAAATVDPTAAALADHIANHLANKQKKEVR